MPFLMKFLFGVYVFDDSFRTNLVAHLSVGIIDQAENVISGRRGNPMALRVIQKSEAPQHNLADGREVPDAVTAMQLELPQELVMPAHGEVLKSITTLEDIKKTHLDYATSLDEVRAKLQELLDEVKAVEESEEEPYQTPIQERIPEYPNQFEVRCGFGEVSPIIELSYHPGRKWIPVFQSSKPATLSAVMKSFDGKRDIRFAELFLAEPGKRDFSPPESEDLLVRIADWLEGISNVVEEESKLRAKRQGYDDGNDHFEGQLLEGAVQLLSLPRLEVVYGLEDSNGEDSDDSVSGSLSEKSQEAFAKVQELLLQAERSIEDLCVAIDSAEIETLREDYRTHLEQEFNEVLKRVEPAALKIQEARLKGLNEEIARKTEIVESHNQKKVDVVATKAALFEFIDKTVPSHTKDGMDNAIGVNHKMDWADKLSKIIQSSKKGLDVADLTRVLKGVLSAAWIHRTDSNTQAKYVHRKDVRLAVETVESIFPMIDSGNLPSVIGVLDEMGKSKVEVRIGDISLALRKLFNIKST